jgi:thioesterase domain-containing protein
LALLDPNRTPQEERNQIQLRRDLCVALNLTLDDTELSKLSQAEIVRSTGGLFATLDDDRASRVAETMMLSIPLSRTFIPRRFTGDLFFFVAAIDRSSDVPPPEVWKDLATGQIITHSIDCVHNQMILPIPASEIGRILSSALGEAKVAAA